MHEEDQYNKQMRIKLMNEEQYEKWVNQVKIWRTIYVFSIHCPLRGNIWHYELWIIPKFLSLGICFITYGMWSISPNVDLVKRKSNQTNLILLLHALIWPTISCSILVFLFLFYIYIYTMSQSTKDKQDIREKII